MTLARTLPPASTENIVTMLLHRSTPQRGWCDGAVLYQTAATRLVADDGPALEHITSHAADLGADGVLLGGIETDLRSPLTQSAATTLAAHAERLGQRLIGAVDHDTGDPDELFAQVRALRSFGFDGADVGRLTPHSDHLRAVSEFAQRLHERNVADFLLTGNTVGSTQDAVLGEFTPGIAPLLRNDMLWRSGWNAQTARTAITAATRWYDANHSTLTWSIFAGSDVTQVEVARLMREPLSAVGRRRLRSAVLGLIALPGTIVLRQGEEVGLLDLHESDDVSAATIRVADAAEQQRGEPGSQLEIYRTALRLRRELGLGSGSLHWVTFPEVPSDVLSFLNRNILVIANLSAQEVEVAEAEQLIHASAHIDTAGSRGIVVPPETTVWLSLN